MLGNAGAMPWQITTSVYSEPNKLAAFLLLADSLRPRKSKHLNRNRGFSMSRMNCVKNESMMSCPWNARSVASIKGRKYAT